MMLSLVLAALAAGMNVDTERVYLSGRGCEDAVPWSFTINKGPRAGQKTTIPVPSCWETQGFGCFQYGQYLRGLGKSWENVDPFDGTAVYRHTFAAPPSAAGRHTDLCFEAVFTDCDVELNGERLGSHQGGFYPFRFDVTGKLKPVNELVVTVRDESRDDTVNFSERRGDYWVFGGIWRPVYLETKPLLHIRWLEVDARADGTLDAVLHVSDGTVRRIHEKWENPRLWTAETPNLYEKAFELKDADGRILHRVVRKIGFRTITAKRGDCLRINGQRVTIKGVNRHSFRPDSGRTLSYARNREDVLLIKSMNMNAVRCSHYPPDPEFLDLCDELGLYVDDELCGWQYAVGTKPGAPLVEAFVTRDQTHPSIIWWSNGNEGGFNFELDHLYRDFDLQKRPLLHPWDEFEAFHTKHYRNYEQTKEFLKGDWIYMPTEFQHGLHDGGHGAGLGELWALMMSSPRTAGGFLWDMRDQGVLKRDGTYDCFGVNGPDGILGPNGEKSGSVDAVREIWSPVGMELTAAALVLSNRYDFTDLKDCAFAWESLTFANDRETVLAGGTIAGIAAAPRTSVSVPLPQAAFGGEALRVKATGPRGEDVFTKVFSLPERNARVASARNGSPAADACLPCPRLVAMKGTDGRRNQRFRPVSADFTLTAVTNADASVEYAWTISTTNAVDVLGITFDLDESAVVSKKWLGKGPYRVWRNRPEGPQLGVWENAYNDDCAGSRWNFPQFKGYFADTRWLELTLKDGRVLRFDVLERAPYVGVFAPKDNDGNFLFESPKLGVSVLEVCPATGDKFTPPADVSPLGKSVVVPRVVRGRVRVGAVGGETPTLSEPKISVFASFIRNVAKERGVSLTEAASMLYDLGVRGFDIGPDDAALPELAKSKLRPINFYYFPKMYGPDNGLADCLHGLDVAARYGVPRIMVVPTHFTKNGDQAAEFEKLLSGMKLFVAEAKKRNVTITVEDFGGNANAGSYMKYLKRFLDEIPDIKFALDSGNLYYAGRGESILDMMAYAKGRIAHVHLKDQTFENNRKYATLGLGAVPNETIVKAMALTGYDGWYTLENPVGNVYNDTVRQVTLLKNWLASVPPFTGRLNREIAAVSAAGGGRVVVPAGRHESGIIELKSNVELYLPHGCEIVGSPSFFDYPLQPGGPTPSQKDVNGWTALVFASGATNIAITGSGTIDGRGACQKARTRFACKSHDLDGRAKNILFVSCRGVRVEGITLRNPAMWNQHYFDCEDVTIDNVRVFARVNYNNDGLDIDSCRRVTVRNCTIDSADDAVVFKATSPHPCEDVTVENCTLSSQATALKFGTESHGSFRRFKVRNLKIGPSKSKTPFTHPGFYTNGIAAVEISTVDGGDVEDVDIDGIEAFGCASAIFLRVGNRARPLRPDGKGLPPGFMRRVRIANFRGREIGNLGSSVTTFEEGRITGVTLENIDIQTMGGIYEGQYQTEQTFKDKIAGFPGPSHLGKLPAKGLFQRNAKDVTLKNFRFDSIHADVRPERLVSTGLNE